MKPIVRHFLRIDARSLGLFRVLFGLTLLLDLAARYRDRVAFYSNDGVLPNHNHLFNLKAQGRFVWSALHAFGTPGEAAFGLFVIGIVYTLFTLGWKTRAFHALSVVGLVSLDARNLLLEGPGEPLAIALLLLTLFLPLGSAFSLDALVGKARSARETKPAHLLDASALYSEQEIDDGHRPGWSPRSIAALGTLLLIALFFFSLAKLQSGPAWHDGTALHNALHIYMFASPLGFSLRDSSVLGSLTRVVWLAQWAIPVLLLIPLARSPLRGIAAALMALWGLSYALLSNFELVGLTVLSASMLVVAEDTWTKWATRRDARRARTVIFDVDCGICFWLSKMLRRYDTRKHLLIVGNDVVERATEDEPNVLSLWNDKLETVLSPVPAGVTRELCESSIVVVRAGGEYVTEGSAVVEILRALPGFAPLAWLLSLPGIASARDALYRQIAKNRAKISVAVGLNACGVAAHHKPVALKEPVSPFELGAFRALGAVREVFAAAVVLAVLSQATQVNAVGFKLPTAAAFETFSWWSRATAKWTFLVPEPAREHGGLVVDTQAVANPNSEAGKAIIASGKKIEDRMFDSLNGGEPVLSIDRPFKLGGRWAMYLDRVQRDDYRPYQAAFKTYLGKRGPGYEADENGQRIQGLDAYWLNGPTFAAEGRTPDARRLFRQGRGGTKLGAAFSAASGQAGMRPREIPPQPDAELDESQQYVPPRPLESPGQERE